MSPAFPPAKLWCEEEIRRGRDVLMQQRLTSNWQQFYAKIRFSYYIKIFVHQLDERYKVGIMIKLRD